MYNRYVKSILEGSKYEADTGGSGGDGAGEGGQGAGASEEPPGFTIEHFNTFVESNVDAQRAIQSKVDAESQRLYKKFKDEEVPNLVNAEVAKLTQKTPEMIEIENIKKQLADSQANEQRKTIEADVATRATDLGIDPKIAREFCIDPTSLDNTIKKIETLDAYLDKIADERAQTLVDNRFKQNYQVAGAATPPEEKLKDTNQAGNMSSLDIIQKQLNGSQA